MAVKGKSEISSRSRNIRIKVVGLGHAGVKTIMRLAEHSDIKCEYAALDSDAMSLSFTDAPLKILVGNNGHGTNADMDIGEYYISEKAKDLRIALRGNDAVIVTCGLGGGTGGAALQLALSAAKNAGMLAIAVVTSPAMTSPDKVIKNAKKAFKKIIDYADAYVIVPNDYAEIGGFTLEHGNALALADAEIDASIRGIYCLLDAEWNGHMRESTVRFFLSGGRASAVCVNVADTADKSLEAMTKSFDEYPLANILGCGFAEVMVCLRICYRQDIVALKAAAEELIATHLGSGRAINVEILLEEGGGEKTTIAVIVKGLDHNPYYPYGKGVESE